MWATRLLSLHWEYSTFLFLLQLSSTFSLEPQHESLNTAPTTVGDQQSTTLVQPYFLHPKARTNTSVTVTIVIVLEEDTKKEAYKKAINSVECYAALHGYAFSIEFDNKFKECAVHKNRLFRRHCHTHKIMQTKIREGDWVLFLDGDVGVVNPNRLIEEYMEDGYDIYLFDQFHNWEYATSSYLVKNNDRGRAWVQEFATFEFKLPNTVHNTDSAALHMFLMHYLVPDSRNPATRSRIASLCISLWNEAANGEDPFSIQACTRMVIGERTHFPEHKLKIYEKGHGWSHDPSIFQSHWATDDFMMNSLKEEKLKRLPSREAEQRRCLSSLLNHETNNDCKFVFPILKKLDVEKCRTGTEGWLMDARQQIDDKSRQRIYDKIAHEVLKKQMELVGGTAAKIPTRNDGKRSFGAFLFQNVPTYDLSSLPF